MNDLDQKQEKVKDKKGNIFESVDAFYEGRELIFNTFRIYFTIRILPAKKKNTRKSIENIYPNKMLQKVPIALAPVKASNTSENLLNEIIQIMYSLYREKEITKKVR